MSIGFCTDVVEPNVFSRAFTVVYILLGASCVGGALVLMVQSILEEAAQRTSLRYRHILEIDSYKKDFFNDGKQSWVANLQSMQHATNPEKIGALSYDGFRKSLERNGCYPTDEEFSSVCKTYDPRDNGFIRYEDFQAIFTGSDKILSTLQFNDRCFLTRMLVRSWRTIAPLFTDETQRIYLIFIAYIGIGVIWGMMNQKWDFITATVSVTVF